MSSCLNPAHKMSFHVPASHPRPSSLSRLVEAASLGRINAGPFVPTPSWGPWPRWPLPSCACSCSNALNRHRSSVKSRVFLWWPDCRITPKRRKTRSPSSRTAALQLRKPSGVSGPICSTCSPRKAPTPSSSVRYTLVRASLLCAPTWLLFWPKQAKRLRSLTLTCTNPRFTRTSNFRINLA